MMSPRELIRRVWYLIRRDRLAADLEDEMRLHIEMRAARMEQSGLSASEARYAARRRFGNVAALEEASRDVWGFTSVDQLVQDVRYAARRLRLRPGFSIPVVAVLALGIGATTAVFSAVDAAILRPLPFARPHELVTLSEVNIPFEEEGSERFPIGIEDIVAMPEIFARVAGFASGGLNLSDPERPLRLKAGVVTVDFFSVLGAQPHHGRTFAPEEGKPRAPAVTVLSYALWQRHFGGRPMLGERISLNGKPYTVVGVMRPGFTFPSESDLWIPLSVPTTPATFEPFRGWLPSRVVARVAPGVTPQGASARLFARWQQVAAQASEPPGEPSDLEVAGARKSYADEILNRVREQGAAVPLQRELLGDRRRPLLILLGATVLLLLIACANVANLLLSDAAVRRREIAVRETLGATRKRIIGQLLAESGLLALGGAALGILLAPAALRVLRATLPTSLAGVTTAQLDLRVLAFATGLALVTAVAFGLWPALGATRGDATEAIKSGSGHGATVGGRMGRARRTLVAAELALAVMLLVGAVLMLRSFARLMSEDLGLDPERVATLEMSFPGNAGRAARLRTINAALERLSGQPGIQAAGAVNDLPLRGGGGLAIRVEMEGAPPMRSTDGMRFPRFLNVSGGYFQALGIPLLRGRTFTPADDSLAPRVAIINKTMAAAYLSGLDPIGRRFRFPGDSVPTTIVGVVADVREAGLDRDPPPQMFFPIDARTPVNVALVARGTLPPRQLLATLVEAVRTADRAQPVFNVRMMDEVIGKSVAPRRTNTILIATFAALALVLSALGVYSVVAYGVAQRTREFGIRAAFGATGRDLVGLVSREMVGVVVVGTVVGLAAAWALSRILAALLYGVEPHDPTTFAIVPLLMLLPALLATLVPALRAMRVSPSEVMRAD
jgi:putative ABC transport system permease protein